MSKVPQPFWAVILALLGTALAVAVLFKSSPENIALAILGIGSNLVSGALGAFAGHSQATSTMGNGQGTISPTDPK
jgi:hypothetical protein